MFLSTVVEAEDAVLIAQIPTTVTVNAAQAAQEVLVLDDPQVAFLAGDGAVFFAQFAYRNNRILRQAQAFDALFEKFTQDDDHQGLIQLVTGTAVTKFGYGLEDAMVIIVE